MVLITSNSQLDFDRLVRSGMSYLQEPVSSNYNAIPVEIVFEVSEEIAEKYYTVAL